ncbi:hypothetical protein HYALB_00001346 [Hymenoscyphus albidus]|uniref:Uncharacterized protein n=1 Tax=Hymenoscyphus albidus TaxID=595503 RepID=A0A9N9LHY3_9HELO|nr:hypothetical protein HYALB_00001346 [Hymenoscyphus albidus]
MAITPSPAVIIVQLVGERAILCLTERYNERTYTIVGINVGAIKRPGSRRWLGNMSCVICPYSVQIQSTINWQAVKFGSRSAIDG